MAKCSRCGGGKTITVTTTGGHTLPCPRCGASGESNSRREDRNPAFILTSSSPFPLLERAETGSRQRVAERGADLRTVRIFLAYRRGQSEGDQYVQALYNNLHGRVLTNQGVPHFRLEVFFDR